MTTTPLIDVEIAVQSRAKQADLDLSTSEGHERLRALINDELQRWEDDVRHGRKSVSIVNPETLATRAWKNLVNYGPLTDLLEDPDVWEIEINAPTEIFVKRHVGPSGYHQETFHDDDHVIRTLTKLLDDSSSSHRKLDATEGLQDAQLDDGSRLHIIHGDLSRGGHLMVNIRRFTGVPFTQLAELVATDTLSTNAARFLASAVRSGTTALFAGAPGSGKTTLLSCCLGELDPSKRVVIAEEVFEVDAPLPNVASMQTRAARPDRPAVDLRRLVAGFLRMAPDVAVVGEVRDREALPLLLTLSSGIVGYTTIHSANARGALSRLRFLAELSDAGSLPHEALTSLVSEAIDLVVFSQRTSEGPRVMEIIAVEEQLVDASSPAFTVTDLFTRSAPTEELRWTGLLPHRLGQLFAAVGLDIGVVLR
jgi:pilus assembly protein CpaF